MARADHSPRHCGQMMEVKRGCAGGRGGHPWVPCPSRWAVLHSPAKAGMPGMQNHCTVPHCHPPRPAAPCFSVPSQEQDIRLSDVHSHTSCYQEKTLSQRLEWALINHVATGASSPGCRQSACSRWGTGRRAAVGRNRQGCWHGRAWRGALSASTALPSPGGPSPPALPPGTAAGQQGQPLCRGASSAMVGVRPPPYPSEAGTLGLSGAPSPVSQRQPP